MENTTLLSLIFALYSCSPSSSDYPTTTTTNPLRTARSTHVLPSGDSISTRIPTPKGFERSPVAPRSFAAYLRNLPLKPDGAPVYLFNGKKKIRQDVHVAVIDMDTGDRDLQQCADAIMRLRAEYLFAEKRYADIHFRFTNGFQAEYTKWREGQRIRVEGNRCSWYATNRISNSYADFRAYLDLVFSYAGTLSLSRELTAKKIEDLEAGDLFIQGGTPGHAVLVMDVAVSPQTGEKVFLLAQSYMPAQEMHVLKNPTDSALSPWYRLDFGETLRTPEWTFSKGDLKKF